MSDGLQDVSEQELNRFVGQKVRYFRQQKGWSQEQMASNFGITFQQIQKYELGKTPLRIGRLLKIASLCDQSILSFVPPHSQHYHPLQEIIEIFCQLHDEDERAALLSLVRRYRSPFSPDNALLFDEAQRNRKLR